MVRHQGRLAFKRAMMARRRKQRKIRRSVLGKTVYRFAEKALAPSSTINVASNATGGGTLQFNFNMLANHLAYTSLFDLYKIDKVTVKIVPWANVAISGAVGGGVGGQALPVLYIAPNKDFYVPPPTSSVDVLNDDGCRVISMSRPVTFTIYKPRPEVVDQSGNSINYGILPNKVTQWLSTGGNGQKVDQTNVNYFGYRWWVDNTPNSAPFIPTIIYTIHFSMKERD